MYGKINIKDTVMAKALEETFKKCTTCNRKTVHVRNINKTGLAMFLVHLCLTIVTAGVWLILLIIWLLLNKKIGGWTCKNC